MEDDRYNAAQGLAVIPYACAYDFGLSPVEVPAHVRVGRQL